MAHVTKISAGGMKGLANHVERKTDKHKNDVIDPTKTCGNYSLDGYKNPMEHFQERLGEVRVNQRREDIKVAASWVITQPKDITPDESRKFFEAAHNFLSERYGKKNVVWSRVHMDESTPHLHFCFMPITPDKKHEGEEKLCAKDVLNRDELLKFHGELSAEMSRAFGREIGIETGQTEKNLPLEKLKVKTTLEGTVKSMEETIAEKQKALAWVNKNLKPTIDARKLRTQLMHEAKKVLVSRYDKVAVHRTAFDNVVKYLETEGGKNAVIEKLDNELKETKTVANALQTRAERAEIQLAGAHDVREKAQNERNAMRRERDEAKAEQQKDRALLDVIREKAPQIVEKAVEAVKERTRPQARGRGMSR